MTTSGRTPLGRRRRPAGRAGSSSTSYPQDAPQSVAVRGRQQQLTGKITPKYRRREPQDVIDEILAWHKSGRRLGDVRTKYAALYNAARQHFGTWRAAVAECGLSLSRRRSWSKKIVINEILSRVRKAAPLSSGHPSNRHLSIIAYYYFGSWGSALREAGITDHQTMRKGA